MAKMTIDLFRRVLTTVIVSGLAVRPVYAQAPEPATRTAVLEQQQAERAKALHPYVPNQAEKYVDYAEQILSTGLQWHPYFESALSGGGFTIGAGYRTYVGTHNTVDMRGSITPSGYKRLEAEFLAPRLLKRRAVLSVIGGWREATEVGYYGLGTSTSEDNRANYGFTQPYGVATLSVRPADGMLVVRGSFEASQWNQTPGSGSAPSVEEVYTTATLPGLGATVTYLHPIATIGLESRPSPGYARRGGFSGVTFHDFPDPDDRYGFTQIDYEAIQHLPLVREAWVLSFRAAVSTTGTKGGQENPFFMLPALGGGSSLRAYSSWRFRDRNAMELQGEWRAIVNRYLDVALFYDTGKVTAHTRDLDFNGLQDDYGLGFRFHGPLSTPLRIDLAKGSEGFRVVWGASAVF
jgi:Omp85 superfamily domain